MKLHTVLLDVDGTLLDSNDAHADSWITVLHRHGFNCDRAQVRSMIGMGGDKMLPELIGKPADDSICKKIAADRTKYFLQELLPTLHPTKGARSLIERLKADGLSMVVATSAGSELPQLLRQARVDDLIDLSTTSDDARRSKPDKDIVEAALKKRGIRAERALMLGDTPYDIEAARGAGVPCIALRCGGGWTDADLGGATAIYDDPEHLLHNWPVTLIAPRR